jgi:hypothetical protein
MPDKSKKWCKPLLAVLTKGKPEESVLYSCKFCFTGGSSNAGGTLGKCLGFNCCPVACNTCDGCNAS